MSQVGATSFIRCNLGRLRGWGGSAGDLVVVTLQQTGRDFYRDAALAVLRNDFLFDGGDPPIPPPNPIGPRLIVKSFLGLLVVEELFEVALDLLGRPTNPMLFFQCTGDGRE